MRMSSQGFDRVQCQMGTHSILGAPICHCYELFSSTCIVVTSVSKCTFAGKTETEVEMPRSILAQLHYHHEIMEWERRGVPFRSHMYVPEDHPLTNMPFHEREDEAHVFKVL